MGKPWAGSQEVVSTGDWTPRVDISETDNEFVIKAEIPDVKKEDAKVTIDNGVLTIQGKKTGKRRKR